MAVLQLKNTIYGHVFCLKLPAQEIRRITRPIELKLEKGTDL